MLFLLLALACPAPLQEEAPKPLPPGVIARLDGQDLQRSDYLEYLYGRFGKRAMDDYVGGILLEKEARKYGIRIDPAELERKVQEREEAARANSPAGEFELALHHNGQDLALFRASLHRDLRREMLTDALVRATRVVTDERLHQAFERKYGVGGLSLRVRHLVIMPNMVRAQWLREGRKASDIHPDELKAEARKRAEAARARILGGEDFAKVAAEVSDDRTTRDQGGEIHDYNGRIYGPPFREALVKLKVGEISGIVETGAGYHVLQLLGRKETKLEDVRKELVQEILEAEPDWQERNALTQALRGEADLQLW